jgi:hypothetical protein
VPLGPDAVRVIHTTPDGSLRDRLLGAAAVVEVAKLE